MRKKCEKITKRYEKEAQDLRKGSASIFPTVCAYPSPGGAKPSQEKNYEGLSERKFNTLGGDPRALWRRADQRGGLFLRLRPSFFRFFSILQNSSPNFPKTTTGLAQILPRPSQNLSLSIQKPKIDVRGLLEPTVVPCLKKKWFIMSSKRPQSCPKFPQDGPDRPKPCANRAQPPPKSSPRLIFWAVFWASFSNWKFTSFFDGFHADF